MKALLIAARQASDALGICFHVGSQAMTPAAYRRGDGAGARGDRRGGGHGRHRRCRRRLPLRLSRHGAAAARGLFRGDPQRLRGPADLLFGRTVVRARPGAVRRICERAGPGREAPRRRALHQRRRLWRAVRRRPYRLALPGAAGPRDGVRTPATWRSASTGRPATISTIWRGRSMLPADVGAGDYVEIGMLGAYGCAMRTGFNGFGADLRGARRRRADGDALRRRRARNARFRRTSSRCNGATHSSFRAKAGNPACRALKAAGSPAFAGMTIDMEIEMTTDPRQRHPQGGAARRTRSSISTSRASTRARSSTR